MNPHVEGRARGARRRTTACGLLALTAVSVSVGCAAPPPPAPSPPRAARVAPPARTADALGSAAPVATPSASAPPAATTTVAAASAPEEPPPAPLEVKVPGDKHVFVVQGDAHASRVLVYLHGRCGDPLAFLAWGSVARRAGTTISFEGDEKCDGGRTKWSSDTVGLDRRITRALSAVEARLGVALPKDRRLVIGYSAGALRAEALGTRFADRYPRVVLIGGPRAPRPESLQKSEAILLMAGQLDVRKPLMDAALDLEKAGRRARFIMIPHARHGEYGPEAVETMQAALDWVTDGEPSDAARPETARLDH